MKRIKISIVFALLIMGCSVGAQPLPIYSQYMFNMLNINPAYAGNRDVGNLSVILRKQWVGFAGGPSSGAFSYDQRVADKNFSFGGQMYFDNIGIEKTSGVQGFYSYSAPFENATLSLGLSLGILNYNTNYSLTNPFTAGDPSLQSGVNGILPTAGVGALLASERWYVGLSTPALMKTKINSVGQALIKQAGADGSFFLTTGYIFPVSDQVVVKPSVMLKSVSSAPIQPDFNMNVWFGDVLSLGASYRIKDAVVGLVELQLAPQMRLGYSYDHDISNLGKYNQGSHEFLMRFEFGRAQGKKIISPRYF